uniref:Uncharacterized protein n=1 Tax=Caudovirales sp. ctUL28 TaxID=2826778 RepID=A0A8S5MVT7_9CAUD|nr:MAG TPA: hypothetical protein [Caudovirales sp. ctUL28]
MERSLRAKGYSLHPCTSKEASRLSPWCFHNARVSENAR